MKTAEEIRNITVTAEEMNIKDLEHVAGGGNARNWMYTAEYLLDYRRDDLEARLPAADIAELQRLYDNFDVLLIMNWIYSHWDYEIVRDAMRDVK